MTRRLPDSFREMIAAILPDKAETLLHALSETEPEVSVRANSLKGSHPLPSADLVPWCPDSFYLHERPLFAADPAWHQGLYYVQDASSMAVAAVVRQLIDNELSDVPNIRCLDACAAPGGKTGAVAAVLPPDALIVANEFDSRRANILVENIAKTGAPNVCISRGPAQKYGRVTNAFDLILADAPCSGEGMMRKEEEAVAQWSPGLIRQCRDLQREILDALWKALRPGGVLVYSTCTFNKEEDEDNLAYLVDTLGGEAVELPLLAYEGVCSGLGDYPSYRFLPGYIRGEGLFICAIRKPGEASANKTRRSQARITTDPTMARFAKEVLAEPEKYIVDGTNAVPKQHADFLASLRKDIDFLRYGLPLGSLKGRDIVPSHELAISTVLKNKHFPMLELAYPDAFSYLRGEGMSELPGDLPRGYFLACYRGRTLGFAKNIGRRANNLYPDEYRLRLTLREGMQTPESLVHLQ